ncbi:MAG: Chaperone protein dnaK2 [Prochlorococcus marinus str. MIT 9215]|nr:MAG: Chaperone protein dnaK2 [Prochlorococcus marinus str. MIT 9215]
MKSLLEELQQELYALGASVYQQAGAAEAAATGADPAGSDPAGSSAAGDDVIDAEFTETK